MSQPSVAVECPSCAEDVPVPLPVPDGGRLDDNEEIHGKDVRCDRCGDAFELLFYP
ncbi:hypothetical protein ACFQE1_05880 [Halobium palmae]|uniref:Small CPxCG-related zinc finger protein n=1 Tax=Halobium palmae TaxID=1776492 RepID=A0ABD5RWX4_9EURY